MTITSPAKIRRQRHGIEAVTTRVTLPRRDNERVRALAAERGVSMSAVVAQAVRVFLALVEHDRDEVA